MEEGGGGGGEVMERRKERKRPRANKKDTTRYDFIALYPAAELRVLSFVLADCCGRLRVSVAQFMVVRINIWQCSHARAD